MNNRIDDYGNESPMYWTTADVDQHFGSLGVWGFYVIEDFTLMEDVNFAIKQEI